MKPLKKKSRRLEDNSSLDPLINPDELRDVYDIDIYLSAEGNARENGLQTFLNKLKGVRILSTGAVFNEAKRIKLFDGLSRVRRNPPMLRTTTILPIAPTLPATYPTNLKRKRVHPRRVDSPVAITVSPSPQSMLVHSSSLIDSGSESDGRASSEPFLSSTQNVPDESETESQPDRKESTPLPNEESLPKSQDQCSVCTSHALSCANLSRIPKFDGLCWEDMSDEGNTTRTCPAKRTLTTSEEVLDNFDEMFDVCF